MSDGESDDGRRASKKRKASRACDRCNVQHQPCDNASPKCSVCERAGTDCTYNRPIRKRGPRTGYTAQYGERLWGLVLRANPELEGAVLQILAGGTYGNTGVSNVDYFKDNDHQSELVNQFNESRLGRFVHHGELPSLEELRKSQTPAQLDAQVSAAGHLNPGLGETAITRPRIRSRRSTVSVTSKASPSVNPHGAPQHPGDIYTLSEDIRKRPSSHFTNADGNQHQQPSPQVMLSNPDWHRFAGPVDSENLDNNNLNFDFMPDSFTHDYAHLDRTPVSNGNNVLSSQLPNQAAGFLPKDTHQPRTYQKGPEMAQGLQSSDFDFPDINHW